ncbi:Major Facilitator Superfamily [Aspergillus sclerotialis]|uniref:Major Facilitator Superfamily n=1 Tax=Aspergillus sclerotialis TaxID=2070753 RepID=A0A3A2ZN46_9EURO|nr:Major Facilitator Superfamily [Aspergillus sclerotialis]
MGSNADVEQNVADPVPADNGNANEKLESQANGQVEEKEPEPSFDEGFLPWIQVFGSFLCFFNSWGVINTWGAFQTYYEANLLSDVSSSSIAWIGSLQSFLLMLFGVITGPLFDAGYFQYLVGFGTLMIPFGLMMASISSQFWHLILAQGLCCGLGAGSLFVPSVAILPQYFKNRRGLANGLAATGSSVGAVIYPIMFNKLQHQVGFPWAARAMGFVSLGTCSISLSIMRMRFKPKEKRKLVQIAAFKEPPFVVFCFAMFFGFLGFYNFLVYVQSYAIDTKIIDPNLGFYLLAMLNAGSTVGRIGPNFIADHTGPLNMLTPAVTATAVLAFAWLGVHNTPGIIVLAVLYGLCSGGFVSLPPVVMVTLTKDIRDLGTRLGMVFACTSIALLIGTPIGGAILNGSGQYLGLQLFTACCLITSAILMATLRLLRTGFRVKVKA